MLLTALPPAPPTPMTVMRGLSSYGRCGAVDRLSVMFGLQSVRRLVMLRRSMPAALVARTATAPPGSLRAQKFSRNQCPSRPIRAVRLVRLRSHAAAAAVRPRPRWRIGEQAGRGREGRAAGRLGQPADADRPADADLLVEDQRRPARARRASWQAPPVSTTRRPAILSKPLALEPGAHQLEGLLEARLDDADQDRSRDRGWPARGSSSPTSGTSIISRSSAGDGMQLP